MTENRVKNRSFYKTFPNQLQRSTTTRDIHDSNSTKRIVQVMCNLMVLTILLTKSKTFAKISIIIDRDLRAKDSLRASSAPQERKAKVK